MWQVQVRAAVARWKQVGEAQDTMCPAATTLHKWLGAVLWARLELRTIAGITRQTGSKAVQQAIDGKQTELLEAIMRVDGFPTHLIEKSQTLLHRVVVGLERWDLMPLGAVVESKCVASSDDFAELLIDAGVDVNAMDDQGQSVLHYAVQNGDYGVLPKLVSKATCCLLSPLSIAHLHHISKQLHSIYIELNLAGGERRTVGHTELRGSQCVAYGLPGERC